MNNLNQITKVLRNTEEDYKALGYIGDNNYVYSTFRKSVFVMKATSFNKASIINIFGSDFADKFTTLNDKGQPKFSIDSVQKEITEACVEAGIYNIENIKGWGIFKDPSSESHMIINTDKIWSTNPEFKGSRVVHNTVFNNERNLYLNEDQKEIKSSEIEELKGLLSTWKFKRSNQDLNLLLGWIAMAPFAGLTKWRTHTSITGSRGTGKSTLQDLIKNLLGNFSFLFDGESTEAGIRQAMKTSSGAVLIDESEANGEKLGKILTMFRAASQGTIRAMGTSDQNGQLYELRMCGLLAGIVPPKLNGADESRFLKIELQKLDSGVFNRRMVDQDWQKQIGLKLVMLMIKHFNTVLIINKEVREMFIQQGHDSRYCDTYGMLISASFLLNHAEYFINKSVEEGQLFDNMFEEMVHEDLLYKECVIKNGERLTPEEKKKYKKYCKYFDYIDLKNYMKSFDFTNEKNQSAYSDEQELLNQILISELRNDKLSKKSILNHIFDYHEHSNRSEIKALLGNYGIKTEGEQGDVSLYIDTNDNKLKTLLTNTRFGAGDLKAVLLRVKGCEECTETSIGGIRRSRKGLLKLTLDCNVYEYNKD